jgi:hypothetical protein
MKQRYKGRSKAEVELGINRAKSKESVEVEQTILYSSVKAEWK